jgi:hypothetical protein
MIWHVKTFSTTRWVVRSPWSYMLLESIHRQDRARYWTSQPWVAPTMWSEALYCSTIQHVYRSSRKRSTYRIRRIVKYVPVQQRTMPA